MRKKKYGKEVCWTTHPRVYELLCQRSGTTTASVLQKYINVQSTAYMSKLTPSVKKNRDKVNKGKAIKESCPKPDICQKKKDKKTE